MKHQRGGSATAASTRHEKGVQAGNDGGAEGDGADLSRPRASSDEREYRRQPEIAERQRPHERQGPSVGRQAEAPRPRPRRSQDHKAEGGEERGEDARRGARGRVRS